MHTRVCVCVCVCVCVFIIVTTSDSMLQYRFQVHSSQIVVYLQFFEDLQAFKNANGKTGQLVVVKKSLSKKRGRQSTLHITLCEL